MSRRQRHLGYLVLVLSLAFIGLMTLLPAPEEAARAAATPLDCILCGDLGSVDFLLNILLFVPLGVGLGLAGFSWRRAVVLAGLLSAGIELLQMKFIPGRDASLGDILSNTLGGGLGALLAARWQDLVFPSPRRSRRLALLYAVVLVWIWVGHRVGTRARPIPRASGGSGRGRRSWAISRCSREGRCSSPQVVSPCCQARRSIRGGSRTRLPPGPPSRSALSWGLRRLAWRPSA